MRFILSLFFVILFTNMSAFSNEADIVAVGEASFERIELYLDSTECACDDILKIVNEDLSLYKNFFNLDNNKATSSVLVKLRKIITEENNVTESASTTVDDSKPKVGLKGGEEIEVELFNKNAEVPFYSSTINIEYDRLRWTGHELAGRIFKSITKKDHIFHSKIVFISDQGDEKKPLKFKQVFISDFDGFNVTKMTDIKGHILSPAVSNDGKKLVYSLIDNSTSTSNVQLRILDLETKVDKVLSDLSGINSGAVFLPGDKELVLTLSHSGNAEIYKLNIFTKRITPLTNHWAADVDPSVSSSGDRLVFLSSRPGKPMIYAMSMKGIEKSVRRISFVGEFNATPRFSPSGGDIVFSSWLDNRFDLFKISFDGKNLSRLTKDFGSNEDPSYSPDGEFIAFTSQRIINKNKEKKTIYLMDKDGEILKKLDQLKGKCQSPRWFK